MKYQSECGGGEITSQQYVMEQFLILLAKQKHSTLPNKFWQLDEYKVLWKRHVRSINQRIKEYGEIPIVRAIHDKRLKNLRSFDKASAWLWKPVLEKYKKVYDLEIENKENIENIQTPIADPTKRQNLPSQGLELYKLKDLDLG